MHGSGGFRSFCLQQHSCLEFVLMLFSAITFPSTKWSIFPASTNTSRSYFRPPPRHIPTSLLLLCTLCRCLHMDISHQDGISKWLFESCEAVLRQSLGGSAGASGSPPGTAKKSFKAYKTCSTSVPNTKLCCFISASVGSHITMRHRSILFPWAHIFFSWLDWNLQSSSFPFLFVLSSSEHKINFH